MQPILVVCCFHTLNPNRFRLLKRLYQPYSNICKMFQCQAFKICADAPGLSGLAPGQFWAGSPQRRMGRQHRGSTQDLWTAQRLCGTSLLYKIIKRGWETRCWQWHFSCKSYHFLLHRIVRRYWMHPASLIINQTKVLTLSFHRECLFGRAQTATLVWQVQK